MKKRLNGLFQRVYSFIYIILDFLSFKLVTRFAPMLERIGQFLLLIFSLCDKIYHVYVYNLVI